MMPYKTIATNEKQSTDQNQLTRKRCRVTIPQNPRPKQSFSKMRQPEKQEKLDIEQVFVALQTTEQNFI